MGTKEKKMLIRINPTLGKALGIIARSADMKNYELIEKIIKQWIKLNRNDIYSKIKNSLEPDQVKGGKEKS